jgi:hypothetical protein
MKKVALNWKRLGANTLYGGLAAAPIAYIANEGYNALQTGQQEKAPEISAGFLKGKTRDYRKHVGKGRMGMSDEHVDAEKKHYKKYFEQLRQAPSLVPGESVVTASATDFIEKRAALQEGQTKEAFGALKRLFSSGARAAHQTKQVAQAAEAAAQRAKEIGAAATKHGVPPSAIESAMPAAGGAGAGQEGLFSKLLSPKNLLIGGPLLGVSALAAPALERAGYKVREYFWPTDAGLDGLPERVRMDELAAESFANSVGKELGKSTVGLVGDMLSKGMAMPGAIMQGRQRSSVFDSLRQEDEVIAKAEPQQLDEAYHTMVRFAPTLATDKNAVKTFLRESILYGTGPNFMAIKQLADAEKAVNPTALVKVSR